MIPPEIEKWFEPGSRKTWPSFKPQLEPEYLQKKDAELQRTAKHISNILDPSANCRAQRDYWVVKSMSLLARVLELENRLKTTFTDD